MSFSYDKLLVETLVKRVERGLDMAASAIALLDAEDPGIDLEEFEAPPDKIIAETAMFLRAAANVPPNIAPQIGERAHALARSLLPHARHSRIRYAIALHPALALDYAAAHIVLTTLGYHDRQIGSTLTDAANASTASARERLPHRELEQAWLLSLLDGRDIAEELVRRTAIVKGVDLVSGSRDDIYAFTHALLYATDFGMRASDPLNSNPQTVTMARSALAGAIDDDDFDLAGELLFAWPFCNQEFDAVATFCFSVLAWVEDEVGLLPSWTLNREDYERQPAATRRNYVTAATYHTGYVMGLLCSVMLHNRIYPKSYTPDDESASLIETLFVSLSASGRRPQWLRFCDDGKQHQALPLTLLLDIALRRAIRRLDLSTARSLLQQAVDHKAPLTPLCVQVAGILRRLGRLGLA